MEESKVPVAACSFAVNVDSSSIDETIEKANRLVELLREAAAIIDSLSGKIPQNPS